MSDLRFLSSVDVFAGLAEPDLAEIGARLVPVDLPKGAVLFREGDVASDGLFVCVEGRLAVEVGGGETPRRVATVGPGQCVGEAALLVAAPRSATVRADSDARLLRLSLEDFRRALATHRGLFAIVRGLVALRIPSLRAATSALFGEVSDDLRRDIEAELSWVRLARDEVLFREGEAGDAVYVVLQGRLQVVREPAGEPPQVVAEIGRGEPVGEMALITGEPRSSTVRASRDTDLLRLSAEGFAALLQRNPRAILPIVRTLSRRLREATVSARVEARTSTVALVPLGPQADVRRLLDPFLSELRSTRRVLVLGAAEIDAVHGAGAAQTAAADVRSLYLSEWLQAREAEHDCVVYVADPQLTKWTLRCFGQADRLLLVARAGDPPARGDAHAPWRRAGGPLASRELVLLHPDGSRPPSGTGAWLEAVDVHRHHHVRLDRPGDARRLARFVAGTAVGVVLGGGGARGFTHSGVLRALDEAGIAIDYVGGVSMGSMPAATYAMGLAHEETVRAFRRCFVDTARPTQAYTLPLVSVFNPARGERAMREMFGETRIEDLWLGYFCTASNITRGELVVQRRGVLWRAMRASGSFPGLFPPVPDEGELLVDGGLLNNLPIDVMQALCPGPIIACDVSRERELQVDPTLELAPSVGRLLAGRLGKGANGRRFPGLAPILLRSIECRDVGQRAARRRAATLYLAPPIGAFGLMEVDKLDEIVEVGYRYARDRLREGLLPALPRVS